MMSFVKPILKSSEILTDRSHSSRLTFSQNFSREVFDVIGLDLGLRNLSSEPI